MVDGTNLIGLRYARDEYFRGGEEECYNNRSVWINTLKNELYLLNKSKTNWYYKLKNVFLKSIKMFSKIYPVKPRKKIWIGPLFERYSSAFNQLPYNFIVSHINPSIGSLLKLCTSNIVFNPIPDSCYINLYKGIIEGDKNILQLGMDELEEMLKILNLDLIIIHNDLVPINQAIILVARKLGIPTAEIQHGTYQSDYLPNGRYVDYLFVWGEYFKNIYVENRIIKPSNVKILGYPFQIKKYDNPNNVKKIVIFLGQNLEVFNKDLIYNKVETVINIQKICESLNFDFFYRPHPGDNLKLLKSELKDIKFTPTGETLDETLKKGDVFISFNSTTLIEANLYHKLGIQLKSYDLPTDNFEDIGACSKTVNTFEELEEYLRQIKQEGISSLYKPVKTSYMEIPYPDLKTRFYELIEEII
ncbi:MAG: hypothetical protein QMD61_04830 [Methanobacterium sp.]|nr:hypothetical protein [Methanobacterium sp.]